MKNKILIFLLLLGGIFSFGFTSLSAQAEFTNDNTFVISNSTYDINVEDIKKLFLFFADYVETFDLLIEDEIDGDNADIGNNLYNGLYVDLQVDLPSSQHTFVYIDYGINLFNLSMHDYQGNVVFDVLYNKDIDAIELLDIAIDYGFKVIITLPEPPPEPPFTGLINFISDFLKDILKSITDMTMSLINNIWDTNLIDINFVILSDTPIFSGTLNDMLYSVFSIFYVIFAITFVWRLLKKLLRKLFSMVRW